MASRGFLASVSAIYIEPLCHLIAKDFHGSLSNTSLDYQVSDCSMPEIISTIP